MASPLGRILANAMFWLGAAAILVAAPLAWILSDWRIVTGGIVWGLILVIVGRFDRVLELSFGGLRVKLQQKIDEATATLEQVRSLAATTSYALLAGLMADEFFFGSPLKKRIEVRNRVIAEQESLGFTDEKLQQVQTAWREHGAVLYSGKVRHIVGKEMKAAGRNNEDVNAFESDYNKALQADTWTAPTPDAIREFLEKRSLLSPAAVEWIADYRHFKETSEIRRPDEFSGA